jgi:hypothetical protein
MGKKLSDKELMALATSELIELTKQFRDGDEKAFEKAKYSSILKKRGLSLGVTTNFIHRIFTGEFDNADGIEIGITKK